MNKEKVIPRRITSRIAKQARINLKPKAAGIIHPYELGVPHTSTSSVN